MIKKFKEFVAEAVKSKDHDIAVGPKVDGYHTVRHVSNEKLGKIHARKDQLKPQELTNLRKNGYKVKIHEEVLEESADADAAADIADHHGVSAQSTGAGHHSVSHPAKSGFFDHHHAHAPLKAAGWKLKEKHKTESMEGGTYTKGEHTVQVMSRHNPHQNTIVHNIKKV